MRKARETGPSSPEGGGVNTKMYVRGQFLHFNGIERQLFRDVDEPCRDDSSQVNSCLNEERNLSLGVTKYLR